jgi:NAD-dependent DNA ligase
VPNRFFARRNPPEELEEVSEVGPRIAESIHEFFAEPRNADLVKRLGKYGRKRD